MRLEEAKEKYPLHTTIAGFYDCTFTFTCAKPQNLDDCENWLVPPFTEPQEGYYNFVRYMGDNKFECWTFAYYPVEGYLVIDNECIPMTYSEDFGWEEANPWINDESHIVFAPYENGQQVDVITVAAAFDIDAYNNGYIFTTMDELQKFIEENTNE